MFEKQLFESPKLSNQYQNINKYIKILKENKVKNLNYSFRKCTNPKISIIIPIYNGYSYIKYAYLSIIMQTFYDIEIIFVDDCSNDNSILIIYELMKNDKRIKLYQNNINKGILYSKYIGVLRHLTTVRYKQYGFIIWYDQKLSSFRR